MSHLPAFLAGLLLCGVPALAEPVPQSTVRPCDLVSSNVGTGDPAAFRGVMYGAATVTYTDDDDEIRIPEPAFVMLTCFVRVNGVSVGSRLHGNGSGVAVAVGTTAYSAPVGSSVKACTLLTWRYDDNTTVSSETCE